MANVAAMPPEPADDSPPADHEALLEAARRVRPYLSRLIGEDADEVDRRLGAILNAEPKTRELLALLRETLDERPPTRAFAAADAADLGAPKDRDAALIPSGNPEPVPMPEFACPYGDFVFLQGDVGEELPLCPTHGVLVVPR